MTPLAFIGLGIMGGPMAGHLLAAGYPLTVNTRTKARSEPLLQLGAKWADTPADAARAAEVVFTCVPDTPDVEARNATLSIMVGGDEQAFARVRPMLERMGKTITWSGPSGAGQLTKLVNQVLVSLTNLAVSKALTFARAAGLDPQKTIQAVAGGAAGSWQLANLGPRMLAGDFAPGFMIKLQQKDLRLVLEAAKEVGLNLNALRMVHGLFDQAML